MLLKIIVGITTGIIFFPTSVETTTSGIEEGATEVGGDGGGGATAAETSAAIQKAQSHEMEIPDPFSFLIAGGIYENCVNNPLVSNWCDSTHTETPEALKCGILSQFHEYGCSCLDHPSLCPIECLNGSDIISKTRTNIRCRGIPTDEAMPPNYIMEETHPSHRNDCSNHVLIEAWCDDYINKHVECSIYKELNQYFCRCSGKATNCPIECLEGSDPLIRTSHGIVCSGIPPDTINYELN